MAAIQRVSTDSTQGRVAQLKPGAGNNQYVRASDFNPLVDRVNSVTTDANAITATGTAALGTVTVSGPLTTAAQIVQNRTLTAVATTAAATLTVVKAGIIAGGFSSTSAAGVTITLDSVAATIAAFTAAGITVSAGATIYFIVDNSAGANTITVAVDGGATWAVATPAITGGATLTVSTANVFGLFCLYFESATAGTIARVI